MFTDTPKLQPISTSRNNDKKVPSNNGTSNNNDNASNNLASNTTACTSNHDSFSHRYNYGSYRGRNYQNQKCATNYKTREFNEYYTNSFKQSNKYNSYNRWSDWNNNSSSSSYNRWNLNHNNNNNRFRHSYRYSENTCKEREESSFTGDSFQSNSLNNNFGKAKETDHVEDTRKQIRTYSRTANNRQNEHKTSTEEKNAFHARTSTYSISRIKPTTAREGLKQNPLTCSENNFPQDTVAAEIVKEVNFEKNNSKSVLNAADSELIKRVNEFKSKSKSLPLEQNNLETSNSSDIVLNTNSEIEQQTEEILNSNVENICNTGITNSTVSTTCATPNELIRSEVERNKTSTKSQSLLGNILPTLFQDTSAASPQSVNNTPAASEIENLDFPIPKISLIPISRLIAAEFCESPICSSSLTVDNTLKHPNTPQKPVYKPNLIKRKRNISTCSNSSATSQANTTTTDRMVDKLVTMSKVNIKNIINSSETKYDEALKMQARKRLREEIRRQLKTMNIEPPKDPICTDFIPDEIVDSIDIPDVVFEEIRKALGLELFPFSKGDNIKSIEEMVTYTSTEDNISTALPIVDKTNTTLTINSSSDYAVKATAAVELEDSLSQNSISPNLPLTTQSTSPTVKVEISTTDNNNISTGKHSAGKRKTPEKRRKAKKLKLPKHKESRKSKKHRSTKEIKEDVVVLISSSSSSESSSTSSSSSSSSSSSYSSSSTSSSDSESVASEKSSTSAAKRKRLKLKVDAENVVDSFEKLILSSLSANLRERYRSKYSTSVNSKLHFISCICTSDYNSVKFSKLQIAKVQKNLKSSDCSVALEFLMKEIVNVFNKQKEVAKMEDHSRAGRRLEQSLKSDCSKDNSKDMSNESALKEKISNEKTLSKSPSDTAKIKYQYVNAAEKFKLAAATNGEKHIQECVSKVLSLYRKEMKAAMQANETKNQPSSTQKASATTGNESTNLQQEQQTSMKALSLSSNNSDKNAGVAKRNDNEDEAHLQNPINCINQQQQNVHQTIEKQSETINQHHEKNEQQTTNSLANSQQSNDAATEKTSTQIIPIHNFCSSPYSALNGNLNSTTMLGISSGNFNQQPPFPIVDLEELKKQSPIGEVVVNNLREIDVKLMELHKRKMYLEEMILKLQKDKMEADLLTIKLQNEKFILLNTAMTANVTSTAINSNSSNSEIIKSYSKQYESLPSLKTIKIEVANVSTKKSDVVAEEAKKESRKEKNLKSKPRTYSKSLTTKRTTLALTKRKQPLAAAASESLKKRCISSVSRPATQRSSSKRTPVQRSTKSKKNNSSEPISKTSSRCEESNTLTSAHVKNVASSLKDCSLAPPTAPPVDSVAPPELATSSQLPSPTTAAAVAATTTTTTITTTTTKITNNPKVDEKNKSLYKNMPTGSFEGIRNPITQIRILEKCIVASSEDGKLYKFDMSNLKLLKHFAKHSEAITQMYLCPENKTIYTTSLDGFLKKSSLENLALDMQSVYLQEPLQSIDIQWDIAYIGSRWGNIYTYNVAVNSLAQKPLCSTDASIISIKATKESNRKILIVSSKGNLLHLRDAMSGLLLRTFDVPESINIYSILLNDGIIYCGTQKKEIRKYDFVSGQYLGSMTCGNGAVSMQMYSNKYIFVGCYDGFIYILDKSMSKQLGRLAGSGKMILTLEIIENKIITSAKDNTMKVTDIPSYCLKNNTNK